MAVFFPELRLAVTVPIDAAPNQFWRKLDYAYIYAYNQKMDFTCNAKKNEINIRDRALPLLAARAMFNDSLLAREDMRKDYPEQRFVGYNTVAGRLMVVVFALPAVDQVHIISFRKANKREQTKFEAQTL